ncbi:MAG: isoprenylcysteine carboxylmethyltransferase family protein [Sphingorhabdus sp.]
MTVFDWPLWAQFVLGYVIVQRLAELAYANANTRRLLAEGGREHGAGHYPLFIILHGGWLISLALFARPGPGPDLLFLNLFIASQTFRFWTLASIGRWWTTRIISAPHFPRVRRGPYRYMRHPNYLLVAVEIALLPMLLGAPMLAVSFSVLNAALLWWRIRTESAVLAERE